MAKKIIVVTGVTRGLGRAMVDGFIASGHTVIGIGRSESKIAELAVLYPDHSFTVADTADLTSVSGWAVHVLEHVGVPDIVVNNAGVINRNAPLWQVPAEEFANVVDVNIKGVYHVIQQFCPAMIKNGGGVFVNFSSGWGRSVSSDVAPYCASKWAIEGLSQALAADFTATNARGMVSVALNPGIIHTDMLSSCFGDQAASFTKPADWVKSAVPLILGILPSDNGGALTVG